jgi:hypothetical protein
LDTGIGRSAREVFTPDRPTPDHGFQTNGIHMAQVVDDIDEQSMGRVWVYVPGISAHNPNIQIARYSPAREPPDSKGAPGKPIEAKRAGFIRASALSPTSGSDRLREQPNTPDGRDPGKGQSNGYGMFNQARNGDMLAVAFMNGDPSRAFIIGHVPKLAETQHVPSYRPAKAQNATGSGYSTDVGPTYNKGIDTKYAASSTLFHNETDAGRISDKLRGPGSSSSTRETPSRVWGVKTPGDPDTNMMGHHMVFDDHPESQLMRFRTSKGAQVLLCDNGDFIYISSCTGKTWIQIDDAGNVNCFAHSSVSIHAEQDINYQCDRDFNLHVGGNFNAIVKGDTRMRLNKGANITVGEGGGDLDVTAIHNVHFKIQEELRVGAKTGITMKSADFMAMQSTKKMTMKSAKEWEVSAEDLGSMKIKKAMTIQTSDDAFNVKSGKAINMKSSGGDFNMDTSANMNATKGSLSIDDAQTVDDTQDPNQADIPVQHSVTAPPQTDGPPTAPKSMIQSAAAIVPQHEPWPGHPAQNPGYNKAVNPNNTKLL